MKNSLIVLFLMGVTAQLSAQVLDPQNFAIYNVHIVSPDAEPAPVNLLVRDNKLEFISQDEIPVPDDFVTLDGNAGYLLGNLTLGVSPSFLILDGDPGADFEVLLRLEHHSVFAVHEGELRRNALSRVAVETRRERAGWHAYSPPPVSLVTHYGESDLWNHWSTENTQNVFFAVLALDRQHWLSQNDDSEQQVGNLDSFEGGEIRDLRFGLYGNLGFFGKPWGYNLVVATNAFDKQFELEGQDNFRFLDYRLDIPLPGDVQLSVGKQKEPISMERLMTLINRPMQERTSVADAFLPSRNFGVLLNGAALQDRMSWAFGLFNDFIDSNQSINDGTTTGVGRVTWLPFVSKDRDNLVHLGLALRLSDGNQGYQYQTESEFFKSPVFVDTGLQAADRILQSNLDVSWRRGPFWLGGEYTRTNVDSPTDGTLLFSGFYVTGSWILTGEMRDYRTKSGTLGPVPVARSVHQNGVGAWEVAARWSSIDLDDGPVDGGEMDILSLALTWWLTPIFNVSVDYRYITNERDELNGKSSGVNLRALMKLR